MNLELVAIVSVWVTAYAPGCGATGLTKTETWPTAGHSVAVDPKQFSLGTLFHIPALPQGRPFVAVDTGRKVKGLHLDVYMNTCKEAIEWGRRRVPVHVMRSRRKR